ncbi:MAG: EAL domain-containing protein [Leptospiraceae bacterium]|nr:EAL domain-containing protein [Leptospiraceae bacterium]
MMESLEWISQKSISEDIFVPHFQPIIHTPTRKILGYEVLGRIYRGTEERFVSLGAFFHANQSNLMEKVQIDRIIREKAIRHLKNSGINTRLFFNIMPNILSNIHQEDLLDPSRFHLVQLIEKYDIDRNNIVIEITEEEFGGKIERLVKMIELYRSFGFKIAIDDVGAGFSNLERIGYIHPDIIKVDIKLMRESLSSSSFRQILLAVAEMSQKLGSELLFEGIETEEELNLAFSMGSSLLQGYYFDKPGPEFQNKMKFSKSLGHSIEKFSGIRFLEIVEDFQSINKITNTLTNIFEKFSVLEKEEAASVFIQLLVSYLKDLPEELYLVFITDLNGYQISPTFVRSNDEWESNVSDIGNNYAWRPYFAKHKAESYLTDKKYSVTRSLYDIPTQKNYNVFTYSLSKDYILIAKVNSD